MCMFYLQIHEVWDGPKLIEERCLEISQLEKELLSITDKIAEMNVSSD